jgi:DNA replication protein DnaC
LKQYLRPEFEVVEPLHVKLSQIEDIAVKLTEDQYMYLDIVAANSRVLCSGGAGTGKTFLAAELARRMASNDKNIALVCKSNWLKRYLETRIQNEFITISTIDTSIPKNT